MGVFGGTKAGNGERLWTSDRLGHGISTVSLCVTHSIVSPDRKPWCETYLPLSDVRTWRHRDVAHKHTHTQMGSQVGTRTFSALKFGTGREGSCLGDRRRVGGKRVLTPVVVVDDSRRPSRDVSRVWTESLVERSSWTRHRR